MSKDHPLNNWRVLEEHAASAVAAAREQRKAEAEKEQYSYYYNRIYPLMKEGRLDFHQISAKTGHKERRIRETLLFRLSTGEVMQLFGRKDGYCYFCSKRLTAPNTKEPLCLSCVKTLDTAIQELQLHDADPNEPDAPATASHEDLRFVSTPADPPDPVSNTQYQALLEELNQYRAQYGPMENSALTQGKTTAAETAASIPVGQKPSDPEATAFLDILKMEDQEVSADDLGFLDGEPVPHPLRQFGFQRMKTKG